MVLWLHSLTPIKLIPKLQLDLYIKSLLCMSDGTNPAAVFVSFSGMLIFLYYQLCPNLYLTNLDILIFIYIYHSIYHYIGINIGVGVDVNIDIDVNIGIGVSKLVLTL